MKKVYFLFALAVMSVMSLQAALVSGHRYTIQPYADQSKYFCVASADAWTGDASIRKECVVYTDAPTDDNGGIWLMSATGSKWNFQPANTAVYGSSHWLNPRTGNNIGNDLASTGNSAWTITPVEGLENVYTLVNGQPRYMVYDADQIHPRWAETLDDNVELNYFVLTDLDGDIEPEPVVDYSSYLPELTPDLANPILYYMKNVKYGQYAKVESPTDYMSLVDDVNEACLFYFTGSVAKDANGYDYYDTFVIHVIYDGLEGKGLDGRNKWSDAGRQYEAAGVKYGEYEGVTIYRGSTNNILAWSDTNSLRSGLHVDYSSDSSDSSHEARLWVFVPAGAGNVGNVLADQSDATIYDLLGRKVTSIQRGMIYIKDGKKFVVK